MSYSQEALAFSTIPANHQVRIEDRISFLYLEYCLVRQDRTGVVAIQDATDDDDNPDSEATVTRIQLPVAGLGVLCLGPGTSISNAAITSCARSGCTVAFSGGGGVNAYAHATPLSSSAKWAIAQARLISSLDAQKVAAIKLYSKQFGAGQVRDASIKVMRGIEGRIMRTTYRDLAKKAKIKGFKRDTAAADPINTGLNVANSIMYGVAATVCAAIGVNPALGIIHRGDIRALLFDLADLYKARIVLPLVFSHAHDEDPISEIRRDLRRQIHNKHILEDMLGTLMEILEPHLPNRDDDRLINDHGEVSGHVQYGKDDE
ncbi:CRISP-associated protein Cas1 [Arcanobacterium phocae]|uniref:CRISPR-associated endonuclease Cas1 n=1 Tax=Arcanobacterium phocae TaxID=131112 RepID=A0A1H2LD01_9ACTO|nr:type I-E CRISPR-associated endonuclease Cas1e [Arcanobacterium phocae]SDU78615.1 CRISP-associated protein Cas1 [Arcanobacterium phocae]